MPKTATIAVLVANGFEEKDFITMQKACHDQGHTVKVISANQGLVNGWDGKGWGHNYTVDSSINTALGVDYDALIIPGGTRSHLKLKATAHTKRIIKSMLDMQKPVAAISDSIAMLAEIGLLDGRTVAGPQSQRDFCTRNGATWSEEEIYADHCLLSGEMSSDMQDMFTKLVSDCPDMAQAA